MKQEFDFELNGVDYIVTIDEEDKIRNIVIEGGDKYIEIEDDTHLGTILIKSNLYSMEEEDYELSEYLNTEHDIKYSLFIDELEEISYEQNDGFYFIEYSDYNEDNSYIYDIDYYNDEYYDGDLEEDMEGFIIEGEEDFLDEEDEW